jgi:hypothetical protein
MPDRRNISAGRGCADRGKTASGNTGIDVVWFFSLGRVLLTHIMPRSRPSPDRARARQLIPIAVAVIIDAGTAT